MSPFPGYQQPGDGSAGVGGRPRANQQPSLPRSPIHQAAGARRAVLGPLRAVVCPPAPLLGASQAREPPATSLTPLRSQTSELQCHRTEQPREVTRLVGRPSSNTHLSAANQHLRLTSAPNQHPPQAGPISTDLEPTAPGLAGFCWIPPWRGRG